MVEGLVFVPLFGLCSVCKGMSVLILMMVTGFLWLFLLFFHLTEDETNADHYLIRVYALFAAIVAF